MKRFIEAVHQNECLWNISIKDNRNLEKKDLAWKAIIEELNYEEIKDIKTAKQVWKKLRDSHRDSIKRMKSSGQASGYNNWKYAEIMEFLLPHMRNRNRSSNMTVTSLSETQESDTDYEVIAFESEMCTPGTGNGNYHPSEENNTNLLRKRKASAANLMEYHHQKRREERELRRTARIQEKEAIDLFLESMAITIKKMPTWMQSRVKRKIFAAVNDAEEEIVNYGVTADTLT